MSGCWTVSIPRPSRRRTRKVDAAGVGLAVVLLQAAAPVAAEGWLSVAIVHPAFEDAAREQGIEPRASDCVVRRADPAQEETGDSLLLHCVEVLTYQPEAFFSPGFVIVGAGPFPSRDCLYAYRHGWLYRTDFLTPRLIEVREAGFYNTGRKTGPRDWTEEAECQQREFRSDGTGSLP